MTKHTERFTGRVEDYERYRLRYPAEVIEILVTRCGLLAEHVVADVGAGTGMLAELFLEHGNPVVAVEPNDAMRDACERLALIWPKLTVRKAAAEATGLDDASVDFIAVGRAFHWFDHEKTAKEFRRILRPGGWVVLVNNRRVRDESPQSVAYESMLLEHGTDYEENQERHAITVRIDAFFAGGESFREEIHDEQWLTFEELAGQTQSLSLAPERGHAKYEGMQQGLRKFFAQWAVDGVVVMPTVCKVSCGRFGR
jgi:ubiquinone/menaquinone biosynthesis C-methylase UbiE